MAARFPIYRGGRAGVCPGYCPPGKASLQGLGCPLRPVSFAVLTLLVSVGRGTGFLPIGLCLKRGILVVLIFVLGKFPRRIQPKDGLRVRLSLICSGSDLSLCLVDGGAGSKSLVDFLIL